MDDRGERKLESAVQQELYYRVGQAFRPAAPIDQRDLFAGRTQQMTELMDVISQRGQHAVLYGERGVGKTSLTTVMADLLGGPEAVLAVRVNCDGTDTFATIWRKTFEEVSWKHQMPGAGFRPQVHEVVRTAAEILPPTDPPTPNDVRRGLHALSSAYAAVVIIVDEFDRLRDERARTLFADTIKALSDYLVPATIVLVGVADNVDDLIAEHESVERALVQIHMPRMSQEELSEIVKRGLARVDMTIDISALRHITQLSQGLPHYTHLLAQWAARRAVINLRREVQPSDVDEAIRTALDHAQESIINSYHKATFSTRKNLYEEVLLACALATGDDLGFFAAADARAPLNLIMRKRYDIPAFAPHLHALSAAERGPVLQKKGAARKFSYRFINPLLQPYVIMKGLSEKRIDEQILQRLTSGSY